MAFGDGFGSGIATCVSDLFAAQGELKAQGEAFEQQSPPARSTRVTDRTLHRDVDGDQDEPGITRLFLSLGTTEANVAGTSLAESGSVLDILRTSAGCADQSRHRRARSDH